MLNKKEYKWLERHTEIANHCESTEDYACDNIVFGFYRPHHLNVLKKIFANYQHTVSKNDEYNLFEVKNFSIDDFNDVALKHNADLIYNQSTKTIHYLMNNHNKRKEIRCSNSQTLSKLSNSQKLDILFSFGQNLFPNDFLRQKQDEFIEKNSDKFLALLQLHISPEFMKAEKEKVKRVVYRVSQLPDIKNKLNNFHMLGENKQINLLQQIAQITSDVNGIEAPHIYFMNDEQLAKEKLEMDWIETEAYADDKDIYLIKDSLKTLRGVDCVSTVFHETLHIAQSNADYADFPEMEEMFSPRLNYLQEHSETYLFTPQELVTYSLEKEFYNELIEKTNAQSNVGTHPYVSEYSVAVQYMQRSLTRRR